MSKNIIFNNIGKLLKESIIENFAHGENRPNDPPIKPIPHDPSLSANLEKRNMPFFYSILAFYIFFMICLAVCLYSKTDTTYVP